MRLLNGHLSALIAVYAMLLATGSSVCADNPLVQTNFTADPAPLVYKDTVYLYTSHDEDDATAFKMCDWKCYSSTDMVNWKDHGTIASLATFKWAVQDNDAWAPQCVERNGKFYLYVPVSVPGWPKNVIGVAVADNPLGPFKDALGKPLIDKAIGYIDPTVWIDDDGQAYLYWGNPNLWYVKLNPDMISYSGDIVKIASTPKKYQEGPWFYKRKGHYYMAYASTCCPEGIGYAMSDKPTGPWTFKGMIMEPNRLSSGNHPGIIDYKGNSYVFGFNYELNWALTDVHRERRSVCVDKFSYEDDGTIKTLPWWNKEGVEQLGTFNPYVQTDAATICYEKGVRTQARGENKRGVYVTVNKSDGYIKLKGVQFGDPGAGVFSATIASATQGSAIELHLDQPDGLWIGTVQVPQTGGWNSWKTVTTPVTQARGVHDLYFVFKGASEDHLFNFDSWLFEPKR